MVKLWYEINILFSNEKSGYNKGKVFQSNLSKNTVDGNCMTKKMLIVMCSTNPEIREKKYTNEYKKKINKKYIIIFFLYLTGFEPVTSGYFYLALYSASSALDPSGRAKNWQKVAYLRRNPSPSVKWKTIA